MSLDELVFVETEEIIDAYEFSKELSRFTGKGTKVCEFGSGKYCIAVLNERKKRNNNDGLDVLLNMKYHNKGVAIERYSEIISLNEIKMAINNLKGDSKKFWKSYIDEIERRAESVLIKTEMKIEKEEEKFERTDVVLRLPVGKCISVDQKKGIDKILLGLGSHDIGMICKYKDKNNDLNIRVAVADCDNSKYSVNLMKPDLTKMNDVQIHIVGTKQASLKMAEMLMEIEKDGIKKSYEIFDLPNRKNILEYFSVSIKDGLVRGAESWDEDLDYVVCPIERITKLSDFGCEQNYDDRNFPEFCYGKIFDDDGELTPSYIKLNNYNRGMKM